VSHQGMLTLRVARCAKLIPEEFDDVDVLRFRVQGSGCRV